MRSHAAAARSRGLTIIELLVATCVAGVALAGAWPFVWNAGGAARGLGARAQSVTAGAYAVRIIGDDLAQAARLLPTPEGRAPAEAFAVLHLHPGEAPETVTVVWDRSRRVLWRKAAGTYIADRVQSFAVRYFASDGRELVSTELGEPGWTSRVARVRVVIAVAWGARATQRVLDWSPVLS